MIEVSELRKGNLVDVVRFEVIDGEDKSVILPIPIELMAEAERVEGVRRAINPIPITPEWLERLGFKQNADAEHWYFLPFSGKKIELTIGGLTYITHKEDAVCCEYITSYVHQLQNLYFALTGEELTIRPK